MIISLAKSDTCLFPCHIVNLKANNSTAIQNNAPSHSLTENGIVLKCGEQILLSTLSLSHTHRLDIATQEPKPQACLLHVGKLSDMMCSCSYDSMELKVLIPADLQTYLINRTSSLAFLHKEVADSKSH